MRPARVLVAALLIVPGLPAGAAADGAWTTYMRATTFTDLAERDGSVWCGTLDAGLLRFDTGTESYTSFVREPGGLAGNAVAAVTFDIAGRLWAGTLGNGASVYEPVTGDWRLVNAFDGLPSDSVRVIEAAGDTLWIGTTRGLALWNGFEIAGVLPDGVGPSPFASNRISGIAVLGDSVWVATEAGVYRSLRSEGLATWTALNAGLPGSRRVDALASDGRTLVVLANATAWRWDRAGITWVQQNGLGLVRRLSDDAGHIALSTSTGIWTWNGSGWDAAAPALISTSTPSQQFAVGFAAGGGLYAADRDGVRPPGGGPFLPPGGPGNNILNIEIEGPRLYATTTNEGIGRLENGAWRLWAPVKTYTDTTFRYPIFAFAALTDTAGRKWFTPWAPLLDVSTCRPDTGVIEVLDDRTTPFAFTHLVIDDALGSSRHSYAVGSSRDSSGGLWFGMGTPCSATPIVAPSGLDHYAPDGTYLGNFRTENSAVRGNEVWALTVADDGWLWVGYKGQGIDRIQAPWAPDGFREVATGLEVRGLEAYGDSIWALTTSDLRRYNPGGSLSRILTIPRGPSDLSVRPLAVARDGSVWIGTQGGVRVYRRDGSTQDYTAANSPLPDDNVHTVRVDRATGTVWIGTARGLASFDPGYAAGGGPAALQVSLYPNPVRTSGIGLRLKLATGAARVTGAVYDLTGRRVRGFSVFGSDRVVWDGRDAHGGFVEPGIYFVRVESEGRSVTARVVVLR